MRNGSSFQQTWATFLITCLAFVLSAIYGVKLAAAAADDVVINEVLAANASNNMDADFKNFSDWIELHNTTGSEINVGGYYLSDDPGWKRKWRIPWGTKIPANGYLLIWADGENTGFHTNFKLDIDGEVVIFSDSGGNELNRVDFLLQEQLTDVSYGRTTDGGSTWGYFGQPTPGSSNNAQTSVGSLNVSSMPNFSKDGGFYGGSQQLTLSSSGAIYYTLDGSIPTLNSTLYTQPIQVSDTTVVRARAYEPGKLPSLVASHTYFIGYTSELRVVSLSIDDAYLFDPDIGIYVEGSAYNPNNARSANYYQDWARPVSVELYEPNGDLGFHIDAGLEIHGGHTRRFPIKSLYVNPGETYGSKNVSYELFGEKPFDKYAGFILRTSGNDYNQTLFADAMMQRLLVDDMDLEYQAYEPAVVFINGEYWGIHNIREKINEAFIETNTGVDENALDLLENNADVKAGSNTHYEDMINYIATYGMTETVRYEHVQDQMDIDQFMQYEIAQIYYGAKDWPGNNIAFWRPQTNDGRWRWILFDTDVAFSYGHPVSHNTLAYATAINSNYPNPDWSTFLLRELLDNQAFREEFAQRFATHINITFDKDHVLDLINAMEARIEPEIPNHVARWSHMGSISNWHNEVDDLRYYAQNRAPHAFAFVQSELVLSDTIDIEIDISSPDRGAVYIHDVRVPYDNFVGQFFPHIPLRLEAVPEPGYEFIRWVVNGSTAGYSEKLTVTRSGNTDIRAVFARVDDALVINEIYYNPAAVQEIDGHNYEFVELYNPNSSTLDLEGFYFSAGITFTFGANTEIDPGEYIIVAREAAAYTGQPYQVFQWEAGALSNNGEELALRNDSGDYVDLVAYDNVTPWPVEADGHGYSLELRETSLANASVENWELSDGLGGTPGRSNDETAVVNENDLIINEIYYEPIEIDGDNNVLEFVELFNRGASPIDLTGYTFSDGIDYTFAPGTVIEPDEFIIVANDSSYYTGAGYPFQAFTWTDGRLSNGGEMLVLRDGNGSVVDAVDYQTDNTFGWPLMTAGYSLEVIPAPVSNHFGEMWEASAEKLGTPGRANDEDDTVVSIRAVAVQEGDDGIIGLTFTVDLSYTVGVTMAVDYETVDGTAVAPNDYEPISGTLEILPRQTSGIILVPIVGDHHYEADETVTVTLSNPQAAVLAVSSAAGTIVNDDGFPTVSVMTNTIVESAAQVPVTVTLSAESMMPLTATVSTADGSATAPDDYSPTTTQVVFAPGETEQVVWVDLADDDFDEVDEQFTVVLSETLNGVVGSAGWVQLLDDDEPTAVLSISNATLHEGTLTPQMAVFTATLSASSAATVTVDYMTASGTAVAGEDFVQTAGTLLFAPGQTEQAILVPVVNEEFFEEDETFYLNFSNATHVASFTTQALGTIENDDRFRPNLMIGDAVVVEGNNGVQLVTVTLTLSVMYTDTVAVDYATADGTAVQGADYQPAAGTVTFAVGELSKQIVIEVISDVEFEADETFTIELSNPQDLVLVNQSATVTIQNDDSVSYKAYFPVVVGTP
ncbi:MAG: lamin tail domain-containing protein [Anaerolineales bacterium]|nr:lamin tail domain-containing protein [Anaerolineales bacterium]